MKVKRLCFIIPFLIFGMSACSDFLAVKPDKQLAVPNTIADLEAVLNNTNLLNAVVLGLGEASSDNVLLSTEQWQALSEADRNIYTWQDRIIPEEANVNNPWQRPYQIIYYTNTVLERAKAIKARPGTTDHERLNRVRGAAHFLRAYYYMSLTTTWAPPYSEATKDTALAVPLRLSSDFNVHSKRATVDECYRQIEKDLKISTDLLPISVEHPVRPSLPASYALLSRLYMSMGEFDKASDYADSCLMLRADILDYNTLSAENAYPFPAFNEEVIFHTYGSTNITMRAVLVGGVDTVLYNEFSGDDLRKKYFFIKNSNGSIRFRGSYTGTPNPFTGLAVDEVVLSKAECMVRSGNVEDALMWLNHLLVNRFPVDKFDPVIEQDAGTLLKMTLLERRKQLMFRDVRWMDLKRLNLDPRFQTTLKRTVDNITYVLPPNDERYALPLPENVRQFISD